MLEVRTLLKAAAHRLLARSILWWLTVCLTVGALAVLVLRVLDAIFVWSFAWPAALLVVGIGAAVVAVIAAIVTKPSPSAVAREVDDRANLRESLSTAMCVQTDDDPWSKAVVQTARQSATSVKLKEVLPIQAPRYWFAPFAAAAVVALLWLVLPEHFQWTKRAQEVEAKREFVQVEQATKQRLDKIDQALKEAGLDITDLTPDLDKPGELGRPQNIEQLKRNEIKRMSGIADRLKQELSSGEKSQKLRDMKRAMRQLKLPEEGPLAYVQKSLAKGDFSKAKKEMEKLAEKLASEDMNTDDAKQLKKQLGDLSKQVEKLANQQKSLEQKLENSGMSKEQAQKLAADPSQMQKALDQMLSMSPEQKQALMNAAKASKAAQQSMQDMAKSMEKMGQCMNPGKDGKPGGMSPEGMQAMGQMAGQLSEMEMSADAMQQMKNALSMCEGGNKPGSGNMGPNKYGKSGQWKPGDPKGGGPGTGGAGQGNGADPDDEEAAFQTKQEKENANKRGGPIIGQQLVDGATFKGESRAAFRQMIPYAVESAEQAIENQMVPIEYQKSVREYFDRLQKEQDEKNTEPAKDAGEKDEK